MPPPIRTDYPLPVSPDVAAKIAASGSPLADLAVLSESACREKLRAHWQALQHPANRAVAEFLLARDSLCVMHDADSGYWLKFATGPDFSSLSAIHHSPPVSELQFPFTQIPTLVEFLTHFSGLWDFGNFVSTERLRIMWDADKYSGWGFVPKWDGSLVVYEIMSANVLVIRPDGAIGKWDHEFADPFVSTLEEYQEGFFKRMSRYLKRDSEGNLEVIGLEDGPVIDLQMDFPKLLERYVEYCSSPDGSELKPNIFYS